MAARVLDLTIVQPNESSWFEFSWDGPPNEWREALQRLKAEVPYGARHYDPETQRWTVDAIFEPTLADIFANFEAALDGIRSQLVLPWKTTEED